MKVHEPLQTHVLRALWRLSGRRNAIDRFLSPFLRYRKYLPECNPQDIIPRFFETEIRITRCPMGTWSTPLGDVLVLLKAAVGFDSKRILELGSYRGDTARLLAENTGDDVRVCAVDVDERHGAAYRGFPIERKIDRKVGAIGRGLFPAGETYDLIFVDADHDLEGVVKDSEVAFSILAPGGVMLWHDYFHEAYFHGMSGVPEALDHFQRQGRAIYAIPGTRMAIYSEAPGWETASLAKKSKPDVAGSVWTEQHVRG